MDVSTDVLHVMDPARSAEGELDHMSSMVGELRTPLRWGRLFHTGRICTHECSIVVASRRKGRALSRWQAFAERLESGMF